MIECRDLRRIEANYSVLPNGETLSPMGRIALVHGLVEIENNTLRLMIAVGDSAQHADLANKIGNDRGREFNLPKDFPREIGMVCAWNEPVAGPDLGAVYGLGGEFRENYEITEEEAKEIVYLGGVATLSILDALRGKAVPKSVGNHLILDGKALSEAISRFRHDIYGDTIRK